MVLPLPSGKGQRIANESTPVVLASDAPLPLPADAATETTLDGIKTDIEAFSKNAGAVDANTLRVKLSSEVDSAATPLSVRLSNGASFFSIDSIAASQKTISTHSDVLVNASVSLAWDGDEHREILVDSAGSVLLSQRHETVSTPLSIRLSDGTDFLSTGAIAASQKTLSTATKALDVVSLMLGWDGTAHSEIKLDSNSYLQLSARHETVSTPLAIRLSDGTDFLSAESVSAAQKTISTITKALDANSINLGWDGSIHRELAVDTTGAFRLAQADINAIGAAVSAPSFTSSDQFRQDCAVTSLTASSDTTVIASTTLANRISVFNGTGISMILKVDGVTRMIVPPGGASEAFAIAAGKALTLNPYVTCSSGEIIINTFT
jgi:hypothetical protein